MRFLVDGTPPADLVSMAKDHAHEAAWVRDVMPGAADAEILRRMRETSETLVTRDVRFANLVAARSLVDTSLPGVVLIREQRLQEIRRAWLCFLLAPADSHDVTVVTAKRTRHRRPPS